MQLTVFKEVHNTWPAKNGKPAGESYDLLCMDNSNPPEHRMEEMLYYKLKEDERPKVWGKAVGTTIQVGVAKIRHGDNGGKATMLGISSSSKQKELKLMAKNPRIDRDWREPIRKSEVSTDFGLSLARIQWDAFATLTFKGRFHFHCLLGGTATRNYHSLIH